MCISGVWETPMVVRNQGNTLRPRLPPSAGFSTKARLRPTFPAVFRRDAPRPVVPRRKLTKAYPLDGCRRVSDRFGAPRGRQPNLKEVVRRGPSPTSTGCGEPWCRRWRRSGPRQGDGRPQKISTRSAANVHSLSNCIEPDRIPWMVVSGLMPRAWAQVLQVATSPWRARELIMRSTL